MHSAAPAAHSATDATEELTSFRLAIEQINREAPAAIRRQDAAALAAWFAPEARLYAHGMPVIEGRGAIERFYTGLVGAPMYLRDASFHLLELAVGNGWGFETGASDLTLMPPGAPGPITVPGKYLAVWQRQPDGRWLLWRHAPSSDLAPSAS